MSKEKYYNHKELTRLDKKFIFILVNRLGRVLLSKESKK